MFRLPQKINTIRFMSCNCNKIHRQLFAHCLVCGECVYFINQKICEDNKCICVKKDKDFHIISGLKSKCCKDKVVAAYDKKPYKMCYKCDEKCSVTKL